MAFGTSSPEIAVSVAAVLLWNETQALRERRRGAV